MKSKGRFAAFLSSVILLTSLHAFGQGATVLFPALVGPQGQNIPFAKLSFCTIPAAFDSIGNCTNTVTVYQNITLTTPYSSAITTDGVGNFPPNQQTTTALWFSPAQNYCYTATGGNINVPVPFVCTPFSVSTAVGPGSSPVFNAITANSITSSSPPLNVLSNLSLGANSLTAGAVTATGNVTETAGQNTINASVNGAFTVGNNQYATPSAALAACPASPAPCDVEIAAGSLTLPTGGITISTSGQPVIIRGHGRDQNQGGTALTISPTGAGCAFTTNNLSSVTFSDFTLLQGNSQAGVNGFCIQAGQGTEIARVIAGVSGGGAGSFTGSALKLTDTVTNSNIYGYFVNDRFIGGIGCELAQSNSGQVVNGHTFVDTACLSTGLNPSFKSTGNVSEISFKGGDLSTYGIPATMVQLGDNTHTCRDYNFDATTIENTGGTINGQVGFQNNCQMSVIHAEGGITSSNAVPIQDGNLAGVCHIGMIGGGLITNFPAWNSTCNGMRFNEKGNIVLGNSGGSPQNDANGSINAPSPWNLYAAGNTVAQLNHPSGFIGGFADSHLGSSGSPWIDLFLSSIVRKYNGVTTIAGGVPSEVAAADLTAQTNSIATATLYAVPSSGAGQYLLNWDSKVTTAAGTSSTLGALTITYTDPDGVVQTITAEAQNSAGNSTTTATGNSTATVMIGRPLLLNCKASTNVQYAFAYASNPANAMAYNLHLNLTAY